MQRCAEDKEVDEVVSVTLFPPGSCAKDVGGEGQGGLYTGVRSVQPHQPGKRSG